jgi:hypothetical protein
MPRFPRSRTRFRVVGATVAILTVLVASTVIGVSFVMGNEREGATQHREVTQSPPRPQPLKLVNPALRRSTPAYETARSMRISQGFARYPRRPLAPRSRESMAMRRSSRTSTRLSSLDGC